MVATPADVVMFTVAVSLLARPMSAVAGVYVPQQLVRDVGLSLALPAGMLELALDVVLRRNVYTEATCAVYPSRLYRLLIAFAHGLGFSAHG